MMNFSTIMSHSKRQIPFVLKTVGGHGVISVRMPGTFPHLLLTGPPGCGKTTVVHCLARWGSAVMALVGVMAMG